MALNFQKAEFELAAGTAGQLPRSVLPEIVFSGRSNVGKSSLINKLLGRKSLARVSATPGKTGTINYYRVDSCHFVDLPGYGYAKVSKGEKDRWARLVEGYFAQERNIALVLQLLDFRHDPSRDDENMINFLLDAQLPFLAVCTKCDKLNKGETQRQTDRFTELFAPISASFLPFSAVSGQGAQELRGIITHAVENYSQGEPAGDPQEG